MNLFVPSAVNAAEAHLLKRVPENLLGLTRPTLRDDLDSVVSMLDELHWAKPEQAAEEALLILGVVTRPGEVNDPAREDADVVWTRAAGRLRPTPAAGERFAARWFSALDKLLWVDLSVSPISQAAAAYFAAWFAHEGGRLDAHRRWITVASCVSEFLEADGAGPAILVRAARLWNAG